MEHLNIDKLTISTPLEGVPHFEEAIEKILPYVEKYRDFPNLEMEFRLGYLEDDNKIFDASVSEDFFKKIACKLDTNTKWKSKERGVMNDFFHEGKRLSVYSDGKKECIKKVKLVSLDFIFENTPFDVRISLSQEHPQDESSFTNTQDNSFYKRSKDRMSYKHKSWSFDITSVKTIDNSVEDITFEVELEVHNLKNVLKNTNTKYFIHSSLLKIKDIVNMCETVNDDAILKFKQIKENKINR